MPVDSLNQTAEGIPDSNPKECALACRAFIVRTLERLGLNVETIKPMGRPSYGFGWKGRDADE